MKRLPLVLRRRSIWGPGLAIALLLSFATAMSGGAERPSGKWRWDIVAVNLPAETVVAGGTATSKDEATGETITLSGSGHFQPTRRRASGGGTFVHERANGSEVASGVYYVRGFRSFRTGGGDPPPLRDGVMSRRFGRAKDGILRLDVRFIPVSGDQAGTPVDGILSVYCFFPDNDLGLTEEDEGVTVRTGSLHFRQTHHGGATVFHRLK